MIGVIAMVLALIILPVSIVIFILGLLKPIKRKQRLVLAASLFGAAILLATVPSAIGAFVMTSDSSEVASESETENDGVSNVLPLKIIGDKFIDYIHVETDEDGNYSLRGETIPGYKIKLKSSEIDNGEEHNLELHNEKTFFYKGTLNPDEDVIFIDVYASKSGEKTVKTPVHIYNASTEYEKIEASKDKEDELAESKEAEKEKKQEDKEAAEKKR